MLLSWAASQAAAVSPPAGPLMWQKFGQGVTSSGGLVSAWADQSGNAYNATEAGANKPALNADGSIGFTSSKKLTAAGVGTKAQPFTFCLRMKAPGDLSRFFGAQDGAALYISEGTFRMVAGTDVNSALAVPPGEWCTVIAVLDGASSKANVDGLGASGLNPGTTGINSNVGISFNDASFFGGSTWDCAEAIVYGRALSDAEVAKAVAYLNSVGPIDPIVTTYTTPGTQTVSVPTGAVIVTVECYAAGATPLDDGTAGAGGGGAYSKRNTYSVAGLTGLYLSVPAAPGNNTAGGDAFVRENNASGTVICLAKGGGSGGTIRIGGAAASGTGDTKYSGGNGEAYGGGLAGGGGGAGSTGNGSNGSAGSGGAGGGGLAGAGGEGNGTNGVAAGGGGGSRDDVQAGAGARGAIKLTWN